MLVVTKTLDNAQYVGFLFRYIRIKIFISHATNISSELQISLGSSKFFPMWENAGLSRANANHCWESWWSFDHQQFKFCFCIKNSAPKRLRSACAFFKTRLWSMVLQYIKVEFSIGCYCAKVIFTLTRVKQQGKWNLFREHIRPLLWSAVHIICLLQAWK